MRKLVPVLMATVASLAVASPAGARPPGGHENEGEPPPSGVFVYRDIAPGNQITECPQAGLRTAARPLDRRRATAPSRSARAPTTSAPTRTTPASRRTRPASPSTRSTRATSSAARTTTGSGWLQLGLLLVDRPRQELLRRHHPVPVDAHGRDTSTGGDPVIAYDRDGHRLLRGDRLQPRRRHQRHLRLAARRTAASRGRARACRSATRRATGGLRRPRRSAPAGRRHGHYKPGRQPRSSTSRSPSTTRSGSRRVRGRPASSRGASRPSRTTPTAVQPAPSSAVTGCT